MANDPRYKNYEGITLLSILGENNGLPLHSMRKRHGYRENANRHSYLLPGPRL